jgi:hypothetical protein
MRSQRMCTVHVGHACICVCNSLKRSPCSNGVVCHCFAHCSCWPCVHLRLQFTEKKPAFERGSVPLLRAMFVCLCSMESMDPVTPCMQLVMATNPACDFRRLVARADARLCHRRLSIRVDQPSECVALCVRMTSTHSPQWLDVTSTHATRHIYLCQLCVHALIDPHQADFQAACHCMSTSS